MKEAYSIEPWVEGPLKAFVAEADARMVLLISSWVSSRAMKIFKY